MIVHLSLLDALVSDEEHNGFNSLDAKDYTNEESIVVMDITFSAWTLGLKADRLKLNGLESHGNHTEAFN